jgi:peptide/nickel transport system substrate-binding protein
VSERASPGRFLPRAVQGSLPRAVQGSLPLARAARLRRFLPRAVLALLLAAWPADAPAYLPAAYGGIVTVPLPDLPVTLDPALASRESELQIVSLIYDSIYALGPDGKPQPHLCEPPEVSEDGKSWRLRLRPGIKLSSGRPLGAADLVASLRRARRGPSGYLLAPIRGIELDPGAPETVLLTLHRRHPALPYLLAAPAAAIAVSQRVGAQTHLLGSGPFRLHQRTANRLHLRANPTHFAGRPYLDEIHFALFEKASAEVATFQVGGLQVSFRGASVFGGRPRHPTLELESTPFTPVFLGVGRGKPYLADPQLRLALLRGIDRARLGRLAGLGRVEIADGPVAARLARTVPARIAFDRAIANRLLARVATQHEAMRRDAGSGRLRLSLLYDRSRFEDAVVAGQLVADLDRIGIAAALEAKPAVEYQRCLEEGRYELVLARLPIQAPVASAALAAALAAGGDRKGAARCLIASCASGAGAREVIGFVKRLPFVPLVHVGTRVFHDARLAALRLTPLGLLGYAGVSWARRSP